MAKKRAEDAKAAKQEAIDQLQTDALDREKIEMESEALLRKRTREAKAASAMVSPPSLRATPRAKHGSSPF